MMIGRRVKPFQGSEGEIVKWEPFGAAMCDVLVRDDDGRECWYASHCCRPVDDQGELPSRQAARECADRAAMVQLRTIRARHVEEFDAKRWPGCEFGKAHFGMMVDGAIANVGKRIK